MQSKVSVTSDYLFPVGLGNSNFHTDFVENKKISFIWPVRAYGNLFARRENTSNTNLEVVNNFKEGLLMRLIITHS